MRKESDLVASKGRGRAGERRRDSLQVDWQRRGALATENEFSRRLWIEKKGMYPNASDVKRSDGGFSKIPAEGYLSNCRGGGGGGGGGVGGGGGGGGLVGGGGGGGGGGRGCR